MTEHDFYGRFAPWWPLISPVEGYEEEASYAASLIDGAGLPVHSVLELGSGGGCNAYYLRKHYELTLVDLSEQMLAVSKELNPNCRHLCADMRTLRLEELFDAVFLHDAIDYMTSENDLAAAIETAYRHCRPGGRAVFLPDHVTETFEEACEQDGNDSEDGRAVRYLEWSWDPDPTDSTISTEYAFIFRDKEGTVIHHHETHQTGLFSIETWLRLLEAGGFSAQMSIEETEEDREPRRVFVADRAAI